MPGQGSGEQSSSGDMQIPRLPEDRGRDDHPTPGEVRRRRQLSELRGAGSRLRVRGDASDGPQEGNSGVHERDTRAGEGEDESIMSICPRGPI